ncbi:hypothetical protein ACTMU2_16745 [Cupriavidus basilensis]
MIRYRFLDTDYDRSTAIAAVRLARQIAAAQPLKDVIAEENFTRSADQLR